MVGNLVWMTRFESRISQRHAPLIVPIISYSSPTPIHNLINVTGFYEQDKKALHITEAIINTPGNSSKNNRKLM